MTTSEGRGFKKWFIRSLENMNKKIQEEENKAKLIEASIKVRQESMIINSEFSMIEDETLENLPKYQRHPVQ